MSFFSIFRKKDRQTQPDPPDVDSGRLLLSQLPALYLSTGAEAYRTAYFQELGKLNVAKDDAQRLFKFECGVIQTHPKPAMLGQTYTQSWLYDPRNPQPLFSGKSDEDLLKDRFFAISEICKLMDEAEWHSANTKTGTAEVRQEFARWRMRGKGGSFVLDQYVPMVMAAAKVPESAVMAVVNREGALLSAQKWTTEEVRALERASVERDSQDLVKNMLSLLAANRAKEPAVDQQAPKDSGSGGKADKAPEPAARIEEISWDTGEWDELDLICEKANKNPELIKELRALEVGALAEARALSPLLKQGDRALSPELFDAMSDSEQGHIIYLLGESGLSRFDGSNIAAHTLEITFGPTHQACFCCAAFAVLNRIEKLDGAVNELFPGDYKLSVTAPLGGKKGLTAFYFLVMRLYPWIKGSSEKSSDMIAVDPLKNAPLDPSFVNQYLANRS